jgi:hypothetical protein
LGHEWATRGESPNLPDIVHGCRGSRHLAPVIVALVALAASACGGSGGGGSPGAVVSSYLSGVADNNGQKACDLLTLQARAAVLSTVNTID